MYSEILSVIFELCVSYLLVGVVLTTLLLLSVLTALIINDEGLFVILGLEFGNSAEKIFSSHFWIKWFVLSLFGWPYVIYKIKNLNNEV